MATTGEIFTTNMFTNMTTMVTNMTTMFTNMTTVMAKTTTVPEVELTTATPEDAPLFVLTKITGDIPEFEIILPCIFGIFIILSLSLMVFYTKGGEEDDHRVRDMEAKRKVKKTEGKKSQSSWF